MNDDDRGLMSITLSIDNSIEMALKAVYTWTWRFVGRFNAAKLSLSRKPGIERLVEDNSQLQQCKCGRSMMLNSREEGFSALGG
jgi:hypothetical protein